MMTEVEQQHPSEQSDHHKKEENDDEKEQQQQQQEEEEEEEEEAVKTRSDHNNDHYDLFAMHALENNVDELRRLVADFGPSIALPPLNSNNNNHDESVAKSSSGTTTTSSTTPLHNACAACSLEAADYIIENTAVDLTVKNAPEGVLALHLLLVHFCYAAGFADYRSYRERRIVCLDGKLDEMYVGSSLVPYNPACGFANSEKGEEERFAGAVFFAPCQKRVAQTIELYVKRMPIGYFSFPLKNTGLNSGDGSSTAWLPFFGCVSDDGQNACSCLEPILNHVVRCDATPGGYMTQYFVQTLSCDPMLPALPRKFLLKLMKRKKGKGDEEETSLEDGEDDAVQLFLTRHRNCADATCAYAVAKECVQTLSVTLYSGPFVFLSDWVLEQLVSESEHFQPF